MDCPKCGHNTFFDYTKCPKCGEVIFASPSTEDAQNRLKSLSIEEGKCPYCKGEIEVGVLKCKHCGEWLDKEHQEKEEKVKKAQVATGGLAKAIGLFIGISLLLGVMARMCN